MHQPHPCNQCGAPVAKKTALHCKSCQAKINISSYRKSYVYRMGYRYLYRPDHPHVGKQGYVAEHRLVMEEVIGRLLRPEEVVHHIDHNKENNHPSNLQLFSSHGQHTKIAHPEVYEAARQQNIGRRPPNYNRISKACPTCTIIFETTAGSSGKTYCSRECYYKSKVGKPAKNPEGLLLGRGWNKGKPATWVKKGKDSPKFIHGRYSKYSDEAA